MTAEPDGLLVLDKPLAHTSHDCVNRLRRLFGTRKVGHGGTLDPSATGVLVFCLGPATRLLEYLSGADKTYVGQFVFGTTTDSDDADGEVLVTADASALTEDDVRAALADFVGDLQQVPPRVSAKKIDGRKMYELHRKGREFEPQPVAVRVDRLELTAFADEVATVEVDCGSGTYIRSLARDVGAALGVGAHLRGLVRTRAGAFTLAEAVGLPELTALDDDGRRARLLPGERAVAHLTRVRVPVEEVPALRCGKWLPLPAGDGPLALLDDDGRLLAIGQREGDGVRPRKVFV